MSFRLRNKPAEPVDPTAPGNTAAAEERDAAVRKRVMDLEKGGRASTIVSGYAGDESLAPAARKVLYGA